MHIVGTSLHEKQEATVKALASAKSAIQCQRKLLPLKICQNERWHR
jgi:hypothetical protein